MKFNPGEEEREEIMKVRDIEVWWVINELKVPMG